MKAGKWEDRYHKQVEANNLLSGKLREARKRFQDTYDALRESYLRKLHEIKELKFSLQILEEAILKEAEKDESAK